MLTKLLGGIRIGGLPTASDIQGAAATVENKVGISFAQPMVEPGSTLAAMAELNPPSARTYIDAVICEIEYCIALNSAGDQPAALNMVLERIHALKNALALTGSRELLHACEQLQLDACRGTNPSILDKRYRAVANAGAKLVKQFKENLRDTIKDA